MAETATFEFRVELLRLFSSGLRVLVFRRLTLRTDGTGFYPSHSFSYTQYLITLVLFTFCTCCILGCLVSIVVRCLVCIVVVVLCVLLLAVLCVLLLVVLCVLLLVVLCVLL